MFILVGSHNPHLYQDVKNAGSMFVRCSVIGRFTLSPGINTVPGAIFFFPFFVYFRGCIYLYILYIIYMP